MGFFGRKKDKEKEKEKKGGLFGWMKRKQADEPEREEQIAEKISRHLERTPRRACGLSFPIALHSKIK